MRKAASEFSVLCHSETPNKMFEMHLTWMNFYDNLRNNLRSVEISSTQGYIHIKNYL